MKTVFCLPDGDGLGGVGVWARELVPKLEEGTLWLHETVPWNPTAGEVERLADRYARELPALFVPNWSAGTHAACAALAARNPERVRVLGIAHSDEPYYYEWLTRYEPILHKFVAVSERIGGELRRRLPHRLGDIVVRPYPLELGPRPNRSVPRGPLRLIYAGRFDVRQKRCHDLIALARRLAARGVPFQLTLYGEGPDGVALGRLARGLGQIGFGGRLSPEAMRSKYAESDLFLQPSAFEGCSLALREAMAAGCVPIATRVSGSEEWVTDGSGVLLEPGAFGAAAEIVERWHGDREELARVAARARSAVERSESLDDYASWFGSLAAACWASSPRRWPSKRPIVSGRWRLKVRSLRGRVVRAVMTRSFIPSA